MMIVFSLLVYTLSLKNYVTREDHLNPPLDRPDMIFHDITRELQCVVFACLII